LCSCYMLYDSVTKLIKVRVSAQSCGAKRGV
jgi:hypothetical protein